MMWEEDFVGVLNNLSIKSLIKNHWMSKKCLKLARFNDEGSC